MRYPPLTRSTPEHMNLDGDTRAGYRDGYYKRWTPRESRGRSLVYHEAVARGREARELNKA